mgnify:FL=1
MPMANEWLFVFFGDPHLRRKPLHFWLDWLVVNLTPIGIISILIQQLAYLIQLIKVKILHFSLTWYLWLIFKAIIWPTALVHITFIINWWLFLFQALSHEVLKVSYFLLGFEGFFLDAVRGASGWLIGFIPCVDLVGNRRVHVIHHAGVRLWEHLLVDHWANHPIITFILKLILLWDYNNRSRLMLLAYRPLFRLLNDNDLLSIPHSHIIFHFFLKYRHFLIDTFIKMPLINFHSAKNIILFDGPAVICEPWGRS